MAYVIAEPCVGTKDTACVDVCPVDCIHPRKDEPTFESEPQLYISPVECIDCGACVPVCPVTAIFALEDLPEKWAHFTPINADWYTKQADPDRPKTATCPSGFSCGVPFAEEGRRIFLGRFGSRPGSVQLKRRQNGEPSSLSQAPAGRESSSHRRSLKPGAGYLLLREYPTGAGVRGASHCHPCERQSLWKWKKSWQAGQTPQTKIKNKIVPAVATIAGSATAVPPHVLSREIVKNGIGGVFALDGARLEAIREVIDNSAIDQRYSVFPPEYTIEPRPLAQINAEYQEKAVELGLQVAERALAQAGMAPTDVDLLITVSCTGVMIPSLDAHIATIMGFRPDVRRLPITELGCAAGAAGLARTWEYLTAFPDRTALLVAVEIPTLTFQRKDSSQANLISAVLFGDGAAGVVVTGREAPGPRILASECFLFPNSLGRDGIRSARFRLPHRSFQGCAGDHPGTGQGVWRRVFWRGRACGSEDISAFLLHPGGQKLLSFMQEELGLDRSDTEISWDILRRYGNLSSASVLFILNEWLVQKEMPSGSYGLLMAFGPGFTAEMLLLQWP